MISKAKYLLIRNVLSGKMFMPFWIAGSFYYLFWKKYHRFRAVGVVWWKQKTETVKTDEEEMGV